MKKYIIMAVIFLGATLGFLMARSQTTSTTVASVERLDPALDNPLDGAKAVFRHSDGCGRLDGQAIAGSCDRQCGENDSKQR